jgi:hypothetical protein
MSIHDITYKWLCLEFPDFHNINFGVKSTCISGKPQAGKSEFTFGVALMCRLYNIAPIMILRNFSKDAVQMCRKFERFIKRYNNYMENQGFPSLSMKSIGVNDLMKDSKDLIICLYNGYQLSKLNKLYNDIKYTLLIDEADAIGYGEIKQGDDKPKYHAASEYNILLGSAQQTWEISATVWDILYGNCNLMSNNIVIVRPQNSYKGIRDGVQFIPLTHKIGKWSRGIDILEADPNIENIYIELSKLSSFNSNRYNCLLDHPVIILHKSYVWQYHHDIFMKMFYRHPILSKKWTVIVEDSRACQLYSWCLKGLSVTIDNEKITDTSGKGKFTFTKNSIDIQVILQYLIDNGGSEKFPHIVIKTGQQAGRSRSYVSCDGNWHLTHEYLVPAKNGRNMADLIQAVRLCHNRPDSIPLVLYAPEIICKEIQKADIIQDEQLYRLRELQQNNIVSEYIQKDLWSSIKVPKYRLCRSKLHKRFKLNKISGNDGGWNSDMYSNNIGMYVVLDQDKFNKGTVVYDMLGDVETLLIDRNKIGDDVELAWINKELQKLPKWSDKSLDNIHGALWTSVRKNKNLIRINKKRENSLLMWKNGSKGYVCLSNI